MATTEPTLTHAMDILRARWMRDLRVCLPGLVQRYDKAKQLVDVQPLLADQVEQEDGELAALKLPLLVNVPVAFPSGGGFSLTFPLRQGDTGTLLFTDRSLEEWLEYGGPQAPQSPNSHDVTDAIFYPGLRSKNAAIPDADGNVICIGEDGEAADFVARATQTDANFNTLKTAVNVIAPGSVASLPGVGSSSVKVKG